MSSGRYGNRGRGVYDSSTAGDRGRSRGRRGGGRGRGRGRNANYMGSRDSSAPGDVSEETKASRLDDHAAEAALGFPLFKAGEDRLGWLFNMNTTMVEDRESGYLLSAVNCYFMCQDGSMFKCQVEFCPYFYIQAKEGAEREVDGYLRRKYPAIIKDIVICEREDLALKNHLSGRKRTLLQVVFYNVDQLMEVKREVMPLVKANTSKRAGTDAYAAFAGRDANAKRTVQDALDAVEDVREYDVPYHMRFAIDTDVRCGHWYTVRVTGGHAQLERRADLVQRADVRICAFDIETTKLPLQFPNAQFDQVFMISYMVDRQGFLIVNREVVSEDIDDFEYTPKPEFPGPFKVWNVPNEKALLQHWFQHMREARCAVYVTYNGDYFDWPFMETRAAACGMDMKAELGFSCGKKSGECLSRTAVHMDCLHWVNRDSYLPQGSRGLKAVSKTKLGYDPVEVDPEDMVRFAAEQPQTMAAYSVSDAVATFYLYMTYIHPFIFSLATIIPMPPDEVLRKGSGTLCEMLLMVEAFKAGVVAPNKHTSVQEPQYKGKLLESETYIGGKVEAIESGVFRSDIPTRFKCRPPAYQALLENLDADLRYAIEVENKADMASVVNLGEVRAEIATALEHLRDVPNREERPLIYHLDVAAMYPNIILTNRLQPSAVVTDEVCAACDFNRPGKTCLRTMEWTWRGETYAANMSEYYMLKSQLASETFPPAEDGGPPRYYTQLSSEEQGKLLTARLKKYCQKVYKRVLDKPVMEQREAGVCMRENDFYVGTVRAFRDRRYEYKALNKTWKGRLEAARASGNPLKIAEAGDMCVVYDSLQLAHKCILNSFYGYVMRRGARWYSMEMAGVVTYAGAEIIQRAARLVEQLGQPLELDTDGIWCALPATFPDTFELKRQGAKALRISYPCVILNAMVAAHNTNDQYQDLVDPATRQYATSSQMSIEFEVDGPYKAMILPASKEEGKLIKKRYAVFNEDGTLAELKGFELKRRGELKLIKVFQAEVFEHFLAGTTLAEVYNAVGAVANRWLDLLDTQGMDVTDEELLSYISESSMMSKSMEEYDGRKSCAITTAKRLGQFLGDERIKDKGLNCAYVIAQNPRGTPTSERALPTAIFAAEPPVARAFLRKWCGDISTGRGSDEVPDVRALVDWDYYKERLGGTIQKIITIPAAMQHVPNPVPRIKHPDWLHKQVSRRDDRFKQRRLQDFLSPAPPPGAEDAAAQNLGAAAMAEDMEDMGAVPGVQRAAARPAIQRPSRRGKENADTNIPDSVPDSSAQLEPCPDRQEDAAGWVAWQKRKWRAAAARRKRKKLDDPAVPESAVPAGARGGVGAMLRQQEAAATSSAWQILQLAPTSTPGTFTAWVLAGPRLYSVPVVVPRTVYINSVAPASDARCQELGAPTLRTLPHGHQALHLFKAELDEAQAGQVQVGGQHIKGIYEDQLPLDFHAVLALGCVAAVSASARGKPMGEGFRLHELQAKTTTEHEYLGTGGPEGLGHVRHIVVYQSADHARGRGLLLLHLPAERRAIMVLITNSAAAGRDVSAAAAERFWREQHLQQQQQDGDAVSSQSPRKVVLQEECMFEVITATTTSEAAGVITRAIRSFREKYRGPLLACVEAPGGAVLLARALPVVAEMPACDLPTTAQDCLYPALAWQARAARVGVHRVLQAAPWLKERAQLAAYAHIPLGNMGPDWELAAADALFGRCLRDAKHLLWARDASLPPLSQLPALAEEDATQLEPPAMDACFPGAYRSVCVHLRLHHLAVCAVARADQLALLEGVAAAGEAANEGPAFGVLRSLVLNWLQDATQYGSRFADALLHNLWRWLGSRQAALYSPGLHLAVASLQRKLLAQLVAELTRLGATVIAADASSLILGTGKHDVPGAVGYMDYLLEALKRRELFSWLHLTPLTFWHALLLRDRFNFLGLVAPVPDSLKQQLSQQPGALTQEGTGMEELSQAQPADEADRPRSDAIWNIKEYLAPATQDMFQAVVTEYLWLPWKHAQQQQREQGSSQADPKQMEACQLAWLQEHMGSLFARKLLRIVRDIARLVPTSSLDPAHLFPQLAGSHLSQEQLGSPALAFTRAVCEVLGLDTQLADDVGVLRRNLLRLTHTPEFSEHACFQEPCRSWVLRDVICTGCHACRDLDLCRDPKIQEHEWECAECGQPYDTTALEAWMVQIVQQRAQAYQLQDLRCRRCHQVAAGHLRTVCAGCGSSLENTQPPGQVCQALEVFRNVARFHSFDLLAEVTEWLLEEPSSFV